ncbi:MAG: FkbM family methyltransferase [Microcystis sp. LE18-22.4A]|jgi:FkbM family methyltransferase|uniref:FkbM family methyltransferase n=1 Tax=Microcystis sp. LE18-22.4A TaxID=3016432 RepID=UPI0022CA2B41|nr:FkbM family methyltransferase [Microcystis sp. LE18-22.4A]MCZ8119748.1 FkbM family methyltransferase [Microcystis sp. LE18-22.4A]
MVIQRFKAIKDLLLDKLDTTLSRIDDLEKIAGFLSENANSSQSKLDSLEQITSQLVKNNTDSQEKLRLLEQLIAEQTFNDNSSLQTSIYLIELLQKWFPDLQKQYNHLLPQIQRELQQQHYGLFSQIQGKLDWQHKSLLGQIQEEIRQQHSVLISNLQEEIRQQYSGIISQIKDDYQHLQADLHQQYNALLDNSGLRVKAENNRGEDLEPEEKLITFLYSFLPSRKAIDIGANRGDISESLLKAGYQVYAFEPYTPVFEQLCQRLQQNSDFQAYNIAIGSHDTTMDFHICSDQSEAGIFQNPSLYNTLFPHSMPQGLNFTETRPVQVRSLESLHQTGEISHDIGLVKIDTEGYDLEVIQGMGKAQYPVVVAEFWDKNHIFGQSGTLNRLDLLVEGMKKRDYHWYLVIGRSDKPSNYNFNYDIFFYGNYPQTVDNSWGNVFFFREYEVFKQALSWCSTFLPMAYLQ